MRDVKTRRILRLLVISALFLGFVQQVPAATIKGWAVGSYHSVIDHQGLLATSSNGSVSFAIDNSDIGSTAIIEWGTATKKSNGLRNAFVFNGNASDTFQSGIYGTANIDNLFSLGSFTYHNAKTRQDNVTAVNFKVDMGIIGLGSAFLEFRMDIENTNDNNDPVVSADTVTVGGVNVGMDMGSGIVVMPYDFASGLDMMIDGQLYNFLLMGFSRDGGQTFESQATSLENTATTADIYAMLTPQTQQASVVPVPSALWLFGTGLVGLFAAARRR